MQTTERGDQAASTASVLVAVVVAIAWFAPPPGPEVVGAPHLLAFFGGEDFDARWQRLAHVALLVAVGMAFLVAGRPSRSFPAGLSEGVWKVGLGGLAITHAVAAVGRPELWIFTLASVGLLIFHRRGVFRFGPGAQLAVAALVLGLWFVPPFLAALDLSGDSGSIVSYFDIHYGAVADPGHRAALGARPYRDFAVYYGSGPVALLALVDRVFGAGDAARDVRSIALSQTLVAAMFVLAARPWSRVSTPAWAGFAALAAFPAASNALIMPNLSGLRFAGLAAAVAALSLIHRVPVAAAPWLLGGMAGLALVWNPETGLAVVGANAAWSVARVGLGTPLRLVSQIAAQGAGMVAGVTLAATLGLATLGFPLIPDPTNLLFFAGGGFGQPLYAAPVVLGATVHATAVLLHRAASRAPASPGAARRAAYAAATLVWLGYYANRPDPVNEFTFVVLWALQASEVWPAVVRRPTGLRAGVGGALAVVLLPAILATYQGQLYYALEGWRTVASGPADPDARLLSGVWVPAEVASSRELQAGTLQPQDRLWISGGAYFLARLTGRYPELYVSSPFGDTRTASEAEDLVRHAAGFPLVLIHDPSDPLLEGPIREFVASVERGLAVTHEAGEGRPGWVTLRARSAEPVRP